MKWYIVFLELYNKYNLTLVFVIIMFIETLLLISFVETNVSSITLKYTYI